MNSERVHRGWAEGVAHLGDHQRHAKHGAHVTRRWWLFRAAVSRLPAATAPGKLLGNHTCPSTIQGLRCPSGRSCGLKQLHQIALPDP
jgi:hypothetical protein